MVQHFILHYLKTLENELSDNSSEILLVEDNYGDVVLIKEAMEYIDRKLNLNVVRDGREAILYLNKKGIYEKVLLPDLIYLDLNLPKKNGKEVLKEIRCNKVLKDIPVIVLTTSQNEEDINDAYRLKANAYIVKPPIFDEFVYAIKSSIEFFAGEKSNI